MTVRVWNLRAGRCFRVLTWYDECVMSLDFNPSGTLLASGCADNTVRIWDTKTWKCVKTLEWGKIAICSVKFNADGTRLASGDSEGSLHIWDTRSCNQVASLDQRTESSVRLIEFQPDKAIMISACAGTSDHTIRVWSTNTWKCLKVLGGHSAGITSLNFHSDGKYMLTGSMDRTVQVWDTNTWKCVQTLEGFTDTIEAIGNCSTQKTQASVIGFSGNNVNVWNM